MHAKPLVTATLALALVTTLAPLPAASGLATSETILLLGQATTNACATTFNVVGVLSITAGAPLLVFSDPGGVYAHGSPTRYGAEVWCGYDANRAVYTVYDRFTLTSLDCAAQQASFTLSFVSESLTYWGTSLCVSGVDGPVTLTPLAAGSPGGPAKACVGTVNLHLEGGSIVPAYGADLDAAQCDLANPPCGLYAGAGGVESCAANPLACCTALLPANAGETVIACLVESKAWVDANGDGTREAQAVAPSVVPGPCP